MKRCFEQKSFNRPHMVPVRKIVIRDWYLKKSSKLGQFLILMYEYTNRLISSRRMLANRPIRVGYKILKTENYINLFFKKDGYNEFLREK